MNDFPSFSKKRDFHGLAAPTRWQTRKLPQSLCYIRRTRDAGLRAIQKLYLQDSWRRSRLSSVVALEQCNINWDNSHEWLRSNIQSMGIKIVFPCSRDARFCDVRLLISYWHAVEQIQATRQTSPCLVTRFCARSKNRICGIFRIMARKQPEENAKGL